MHLVMFLNKEQKTPNKQGECDDQYHIDDLQYKGDNHLVISLPALASYSCSKQM